jgi:hypothetical protein
MRDGSTTKALHDLRSGLMILNFAREGLDAAPHPLAPDTLRQYLAAVDSFIRDAVRELEPRRGFGHAPPPLAGFVCDNCGLTFSGRDTYVGECKKAEDGLHVMAHQGSRKVVP